MARWCKTCGREKELHEVIERIDSGVATRERKNRIRVCRLRPVKKGGKDTGRKVADRKAYSKERKKAEKRRAKRLKERSA